MGLSQMIAEGANRLGLMRSGVANLDERIKRLEAERKAADPARGWALGQEIRRLHDERLAGAELLNEAERRTAENTTAFRAAEDDAMANLGKVQSAVLAAAKRVDTALAEACEAVAECEQLLEPWNLTLCPSGVIRRYCGMATIDSAVRQAFLARLDRAAQVRERKSFSDSISWLAGVARENAGRLKRQRGEAL